MTIDGIRPSPSADVSRSGDLQLLAETIIACEKCPRLRRHGRLVAREKRRAYLGEDYWGRPVPGFGDPEAHLLIVGLAPAAHGGNRTGRVFTGDSSGEWLYEALHRFGFSSSPRSVSRDDGLTLPGAYITAAARCAPPANRPTPRELDACRPYLAREIHLLDRARVVVALGRVGYEAWLKASGWWEKLPPRRRPRFGHAVESRLPDGTILLCSFHPSRQNTNTGRLTRRMWHSIFRRARRIVDGLPQGPREAGRDSGVEGLSPRSGAPRRRGDGSPLNPPPDARRRRGDRSPRPC